MCQFEYTYGVQFIVLYDSDLNNSIENGGYRIEKSFGLVDIFKGIIQVICLSINTLKFICYKRLGTQMAWVFMSAVTG